MARQWTDAKRSDTRRLADALKAVMLTEAVPDAYSREDADRAWEEALDALEGHVPGPAHEMVVQAAREHRRPWSGE